MREISSDHKIIGSMHFNIKIDLLK